MSVCHNFSARHNHWPAKPSVASKSSSHFYGGACHLQTAGCHYGQRQGDRQIWGAMLIGGAIKGCYGLAACRQLAQLTTSQKSAISDREVIT
jgi:hypothetical protein